MVNLTMDTQRLVPTQHDRHEVHKHRLHIFAVLCIQLTITTTRTIALKSAQRLTFLTATNGLMVVNRCCATNPP